LDARRKEYLETIKTQEKQQNALNTVVDVKQTVTRVTIEGEHTCMLVIRRTGDAGLVKSGIVELELMPILNAPHQCASVTIAMKNIKLVLTYRYLFSRNALRIVTYQN
jgi:hypothetical protein